MSSCCIQAAIEDTLPEIAGAPAVRLLEAAGFTPTVAAGGFAFTIKCPCCGGVLGVDSDRVRCRPGCILQHGRLVDALAYKLKCKHRSLRRVLEDRAKWLEKRPKWCERISEYLRAASKLHWLNLAAKGHLTAKDNIDLSRLRSWVSKIGMEELHQDGTAVLLDGDTVRKLGSVVTGVPGPGKERLALFYWLDNATPVAVSLGGPQDDPFRINFQSFAVAVTGLHLEAQGSRTLWQSSECLLHNKGDFRHEAWVSGNGTLGPHIPVTIVDRNIPEDWLGWGRILLGCPNCSVHVTGKDETPDAWLMQTLMRLTTDDKWPAQASALVECLCAPGDGMTVILSELQARGRANAAKQLKGRMLTATVWSDDKYQLKRTALGMILHDMRQGTSREIGNFLIDASCNIVFPETSEIVHEMIVEVHGTRFPVEIGSGDLHSATKLQDALRIGAAHSGCDVLPMVSDQSACTKHMLPWLRRTAAVAKQVVGRSMLGWNPERTAFQSSAWRLTNDSWTEGEARLKTSVPALACFDSKPMPADPGVMDLPQPARDMLAMIAGLISRYYVRSRVKAVCVQNSAAARGLLKAIFRGFGQIRELEMTAFRGIQALQGIQGHPLLATGLSQIQADNLPMPVIMLSDTGYSVQAYSDEDSSKITACSRWVLQRIVDWLLVTEGKDFSERHAFRFSLGLMDEGAKVLQKACELQSWEITIPEFPALQTLVRDVKPEKAWDRFVLLDESRAKIVCGDLVKANDLTMELLLLGIHAKDEDGSLIVPAAPLITLLQDYWGVSPMLVS